MPEILLRRSASGRLFDTAGNPHPGLFLSRGLRAWKISTTQKGEDFQKHVVKTAGLTASDIYTVAYNRWISMAVANETMSTWAGNLDGRLYIGLGGASVIETAITLSRTYGVPVIPGSAQKGLTRAYASRAGLGEEDLHILFGKEGQTPEECDAGYVIFHDAWWIPQSCTTPLHQEIITVHHQEYYQGNGDIDATDFDSPVPNVQVAARGSFLFCVECADPKWAALACDLLAQALNQWGIGGKTAAGYGRFEADEKENRKISGHRKEQILSTLPLEERLHEEVKSWSESQLAKKIGKGHNKLRKQYGDQWDIFLDALADVWGDRIQGWDKDKNNHRKRTYKIIFNR